MQSFMIGRSFFRHLLLTMFVATVGLPSRGVAQEPAPAPATVPAPGAADAPAVPPDEAAVEGNPAGAPAASDYSNLAPIVREPVVIPNGMWVAGGLAVNVTRGPWPWGGGSVELGLPLARDRGAELDLVLPLYSGSGWPHFLAFTPEVQYAIALDAGIDPKIELVPSVGLGALFYFDLNSVAISIPVGFTARVTFPSGVLIQMTPVGFTFDVIVSDAEDWGDRFFMKYQFFLEAGYRFGGPESERSASL